MPVEVLILSTARRGDVISVTEEEISRKMLAFLRDQDNVCYGQVFNCK